MYKINQKDMMAMGFHTVKSSLDAALQRTVCHRTLADQNLFISDQSQTLVGHNAQAYVKANIIFTKKNMRIKVYLE